jgi:hypothetical protein
MDAVKLNAPMPDGNKCPQCGTPLPSGALAGLCPACLLKMGAAADTATDAKGKTFTPPPVAELALLFPQLEILELIGKGGMGAVYKARQRQLDRVVALKILPPGIGHDAAFAERFTREAKSLAKLNHPGIVTLYEFGVTSGYQPSTLNSQLFYFLMEFVDGVNLRQLLAGGRVAAREALLDSLLKEHQSNKTIWMLQPGFDPRLNSRQDSFCFKTSKGAVGILQIVDAEDNPAGVRVRYKLVQNSNQSDEKISEPLKPIPPEAAVLAAAMKAETESFLREHDPKDTNAMFQFQKEMDVRQKEMTKLLQGTIAEPLVMEQIERMQAMADQVRINGRMDTNLEAQLNSGGKQLEAMIMAAAPAAASPFLMYHWTPAFGD